MSQVVHYKGVLTPVDRLESETLEEQCKRVLSNCELPSYCSSYVEYVKAEVDSVEALMIVKDTLYRVEVDYINDVDAIYNAKVNDDGTVNIEVKYYTGGCGFAEAVDEAFKSLS